MRTHLLRTSYPSPAIELDTDSAANDDCFASDASSVKAQGWTNSDEHSPDANSLHDEYVLGGYAGI